MERSENKGEQGREVHFTGRQLRVGRKVVHLDLDIEQEVLSWLLGLRRMPWAAWQRERSSVHQGLSSRPVFAVPSEPIAPARDQGQDLPGEF